MNHLRPVLRPNWPAQYNPFFAAIISRHVRKKDGTSPLTGAQVRAELDGREPRGDHPPDLIVAGDDVVGLPFVRSDTDQTDTYYGPFAVANSHIRLEERPKLAFAIGFCSLMHALETIRLGLMPWPEIIADAIDAEMGT